MRLYGVPWRGWEAPSRLPPATSYRPLSNYIERLPRKHAVEQGKELGKPQKPVKAGKR
jgi:hypothetical protein